MGLTSRPWLGGKWHRGQLSALAKLLRWRGLVARFCKADWCLFIIYTRKSTDCDKMTKSQMNTCQTGCSAPPLVAGQFKWFWQQHCPSPSAPRTSPHFLHTASVSSSWWKHEGNLTTQCPRSGTHFKIVRESLGTDPGAVLKGTTAFQHARASLEFLLKTVFGHLPLKRMTAENVAM